MTLFNNVIIPNNNNNKLTSGNNVVNETHSKIEMMGHSYMINLCEEKHKTQISAIIY